MCESKLNKIKIDGKNNITIQDVSNSTVVVNTTNLDELQALVSDLQAWQSATFSNTVSIFVLTTSRQRIEEIYKDFTEFPIPFEQYGEQPKDWKPFAEHGTIVQLLAEFHQTSGFKLDAYFIDNWFPESDEIQAMLREDIIPHTILIADGLAFDFEANREFARLFDDTSIGGCLIPTCRKSPETLRFYVQQRQRQLFKLLNTCFYRRFNKEYLQIEPNITTKEELFRRITNVAVSRLNIRPLSVVNWHEKVLGDKSKNGIENLKSGF